MPVNKIKIIHILPHSPGPNAYMTSPDSPPNSSNPDDLNYYIKIPEPPYWIGFYQNDFHVRLASSSLKASSLYDIECWRIYEMIDEVYEKEVNGITHKLFPANKSKFHFSFFDSECSEMINELKSEISKGKVVLHLHGYHNPRLEYLMLRLNLGGIPVVVTHRGGPAPFFTLRKKPWKIINYIFEKMTSPQIDFFLLQSKIETDYYRKIHGVKKVLQFKDGLDFDFFNPIDKNVAREKLDIPLISKVLIFVGIFTENRGISKMKSLHKGLNKKYDDVRMFMIGGHPSHQLYKEAQESEAVVLPRIKQEELLYYYSASDLHVHITPDQMYRNHTGIGNANIESLACNTPIFTSQLIHFLGTDQEKEMVGLDSGLVTDDEDCMVDGVTSILENPEKYINCREIANKYYDRRKNTLKVLEIYHKLTVKYYGS